MKTPNQKDPVVRLEFTEAQQALVKRATGRDSVAIELTVEELEERIAPSGTDSAPGRLASNHNEPLMVDG